MTYTVTFIRGDGTGPELAEATARVLEATGVGFEWDWQDAGTDVYEQEGTPMPDRVLESIRRNKLAMKAPITTPVGSGFRSVNVALRKDLDLYACLRPCKAYEGVRTRFPETDIVIVRENHEDLYAGIEFEEGSEEAGKLRDAIKELTGKEIRPDSGISIKPISIFGTTRIVRSAFEYARENGRRKVTAAHKANIMKFSDGLFLRTAQEVAKDYSDIEFEDRIIDNLCNQLVSRPEEYDVVVLPNLYGDIVSDLCAGLVGGLGVVGAANLGGEVGVFEAVHGSAPDIAGKNIANPTALLRSALLMLHHIGESHAAGRIESALVRVLATSARTTRDLGGTATTTEFADAICHELGRAVPQ